MTFSLHCRSCTIGLTYPRDNTYNRVWGDLFLESQTLPFCLEVQMLHTVCWTSNLSWENRSCFPRIWVYLSHSVLSTNTLCTAYGSLLFFNWGLCVPRRISFHICFFLTVFRINIASFAWIHPRPTWSCQILKNVTLSWKRIQLLQHLKYKDSIVLVDEPFGRDTLKTLPTHWGLYHLLPHAESGNRYSEHHTLTKRGSWNQHSSSLSTKR